MTSRASQGSNQWKMTYSLLSFISRTSVLFLLQTSAIIVNKSIKYTAFTMDTVNRVVESASKAIWGEQNGGQATASNSQGMTGIESVDKVVDAGKKAIWGDTADQSSSPHGEEPVAGKTGLGTATDPYDAGNRDGMFLYSLGEGIVHLLVWRVHRTTRCSIRRSWGPHSD
jgi:hypothetical protein